MDQETIETIILQGEDGSEIECEFGDRFTWHGEDYVIMIPYIDGRKDENSVLLMQTVKDEDEADVEYLVAVEDLEKMNEIFSDYVRELAEKQHGQ